MRRIFSGSEEKNRRAKEASEPSCSPEKTIQIDPPCSSSILYPHTHGGDRLPSPSFGRSCIIDVLFLSLYYCTIIDVSILLLFPHWVRRFNCSSQVWPLRHYVPIVSFPLLEFNRGRTVGVYVPLDVTLFTGVQYEPIYVCLRRTMESLHHDHELVRNLIENGIGSSKCISCSCRCIGYPVNELFRCDLRRPFSLADPPSQFCFRTGQLICTH